MGNPREPNSLGFRLEDELGGRRRRHRRNDAGDVREPRFPAVTADAAHRVPDHLRLFGWIVTTPHLEVVIPLEFRPAGGGIEPRTVEDRDTFAVGDQQLAVEFPITGALTGRGRLHLDQGGPPEFHRFQIVQGLPRGRARGIAPTEDGLLILLENTQVSGRIGDADHRWQGRTFDTASGGKKRCRRRECNRAPPAG